MSYQLTEMTRGRLRALHAKKVDLLSPLNRRLYSKIFDFEARQNLAGNYLGVRRNDPTARRSMQAIIQRAWEFVRTHGDRKTQAAAQQYHRQFGVPQLSTRSLRTVGGVTSTQWSADMTQQVSSQRIEVSDKWMARRRRHGSAVLAVARTLLHELMGHWAMVGQRLQLENQHPRARKEERKTKAEERADKVETKLWTALKKRIEASPQYQAFVRQQRSQREREIAKAIQDYLLDLALSSISRKSRRADVRQ